MSCKFEILDWFSARRSPPSKNQIHTYMKTTTKNYGPFEVRAKSIKAKLKNGFALLTCNRQSGTTPLGKKYNMRSQWFIKFENNPCAMGPWSSEAIRSYFA